jgi:D-glycero-alpha-D-manno-heptose-7-phosphate kinase
MDPIESFETIISRTPFRLPLGGGGTDLPSYYKQFGGFFISAAINKYMSIVIHRNFSKSLRLAYSKTEIVNTPEEIDHPLIREGLKKTGIKHGIEIMSFADIPASTGLGSSGSFAVGLLKGLYAVKREYRSPGDLADEACDISMNILKEPSGKQDEYVASFGGIRAYTVSKSGKVESEELKLSQSTIAELESNIMLFYTGMTRSSGDVLGQQQKNIRSGSSVEYMHRIKEIGLKSKEALEKGDLTRFGELLHEHWLEKKKVTTNMTNSIIDGYVDVARENGAIGEKLLGAGGGGFLMVYAEKDHRKIRLAMEKMNLVEQRFRFDFEGSKVVYNI